LRCLGHDLIKKTYCEGDLYHYSYNADGFEEMSYLWVRYELLYLERCAGTFKDEHVLDVVESHLKAHIVAVSVLDSECGSRERRIQRLASLLREYRALNEKRYHNIIKTYSEFPCCVEAVKLITCLDKRTRHTVQRGAPESVSIAREKYLREMNRGVSKEPSEDD
jgi:hypothetical protein